MQKNIVAIQIDDLETLNYETDTSLLLGYGLQNCEGKYRIFLYNPSSISYINNGTCESQKLLAEGAFYEIDYPNRKNFNLTKISDDFKLELESASAILVRQNPPFDMNYITNLYLLKTIKHKTLILNDPDILLNWPEKFVPLFLNFPVPETLITKEIIEALGFIQQHGVVILKPIYGFGGSGIIKIDSNDYSSESELRKIVEEFIEINANKHIIIQKFIQSVYSKGDYRAIMINGKLVTCFRRIPESGNFVANLAQGGSAEKLKALSDDLLKSLNKIAKTLDENGIFFAGVDIIEDKIIEVNITSPTGIVTACHLEEAKLEDSIANTIHKKIKSFA